MGREHGESDNRTASIGQIESPAVIPVDLVGQLRDLLGLGHAIETGTHLGGGARTLAGLFTRVTSIELSRELHARAVRAHTSVGNLDFVRGDSAERLHELIDPAVPTLYYLDGHWSGGTTAGVERECPVLAEIAATAAGHLDDCILIDDARLFQAAPPPPHDPAQWPTLLEVFGALRRGRPDHHVTVLADLVIAVPGRAKPAVDRFGQRTFAPPERSTVARLLGRVARHRG